MKFSFDAHQPYQQDAIKAVVDLFQGQPQDAGNLRSSLNLLPEEQATLDVAIDTGALGNNLLLDDAAILDNLRKVQNANGVPISPELVDGRQFDIEMETGTGKTYVYLRTAFELAKKYRFTKFIIVVPSIAIREGVKTSFDLMEEHFRELYPGMNWDVSVYSGDRAEDVRDFATATTLQFLIVTSASIKGDKNSRIMRQQRDKLNGLRPVDFLSATYPILILDEPQNMESDLSQSAFVELNPMCTLRYSATHAVTRNKVYQLDPVDAHALELVKQIVVADAAVVGEQPTPYIKLLKVQRDPKFKATVELLVKDKKGVISRKKKILTNGADLEVASGGNAIYSGNWRISGMGVEPEHIELTNYGRLEAGQEIGGNKDAIYREMIRETIREHLYREQMLKMYGIKVLSLFFIDRVASYVGDGHNSDDANGPFVQWFDELYREELAKNPLPHMPTDPRSVRSAYFAQDKKGKAKDKAIIFKDTKGSSKEDNDAYELIMKDKARLLDQNEAVRFIFSHSALREGWDNPNVFQICTLRDMGSNVERRQTIGRGLRLPVNSHGHRVSDRKIAQLTVIADESYSHFAAALQDEYRRAKVAMGFVRVEEFAKLSLPTQTGEDRIGTEQSQEIWEILLAHQFIDEQGNVLDTFLPETVDCELELPEKFEPLRNDIVDIVLKCRIQNIVKPKRSRVKRTYNKQLWLNAEFQDFWEKIAQKTTYRVTFDRSVLISRCVSAIQEAPRIDPVRIRVSHTTMNLTRGGTQGQLTSEKFADLTTSYPLPDIVTELQESTKLTRRTIIDILTSSGRLHEFQHNPNEFIAMVKQRIEDQLSHLIVDGVEYERIAGQVYEFRQLESEALADADHFIDRLYEVKNKQKTDFNYVLIDSEVERKFAEYLDMRDDITLFMKLPGKFLIPTPVGDYNPDWAIIKRDEDGIERLYLIRETKSSQDPMKRRPAENAKIKAAHKHFAAIGVNYAVSAPSRWEI